MEQVAEFEKTEFKTTNKKVSISVQDFPCKSTSTFKWHCNLREYK